MPIFSQLKTSTADVLTDVAPTLVTEGISFAALAPYHRCVAFRAVDLAVPGPGPVSTILVYGLFRSKWYLVDTIDADLTYSNIVVDLPEHMVAFDKIYLQADSVVDIDYKYFIMYDKPQLNA
jgi:hypothetical protein